MFRYLDFISVKTFDLHGGQDGVTAHHSSLYSENKANIVITLFYLRATFMSKGKVSLIFNSVSIIINNNVKTII